MIAGSRGSSVVERLTACLRRQAQFLMLQMGHFKPVKAEGTSVLESEFSISEALSSIPNTSPMAIRGIVFLFKFQRHLLSMLFHPQVVDQLLPSGSEMSSEETECLWGKDGAMLKLRQLFQKLGMMSWDVSFFILPDFQSLHRSYFSQLHLQTPSSSHPPHPEMILKFSQTHISS